MTDEDIPLHLTAAEETFEYWRRRVGLVLGPLLFLLLLWFPVPGLTPEAQRLIPALVLAIVFWLTEAIPMAATALLAPALCVPLGMTGQANVLAPFASPSIFMFIGSFFIAAAMHVHGLDRRIALWLLTRPGATRTPFTLYATMGVLTATLSMWMSNVATTAMMMPIGLSVLAACPGLDGNRAAQCNLVLLIAFSASIGGLGTPVGTPPNIMTMGFLREMNAGEVTFFGRAAGRRADGFPAVAAAPARACIFRSRRDGSRAACAVPRARSSETRGAQCRNHFQYRAIPVDVAWAGRTVHR